MGRIILNELKYTKDLLETHDKNRVDISITQLIWLIAKYHNEFSGVSDKEELFELVNNDVNAFEFDEYYDIKWYKQIMKCCTIVYKYGTTLKRHEYIPIYKYEYDYISHCKTDKERKLLFTLFVLARYSNSNGWIKNTITEKQIFSMANIRDTRANRNMLIYQLFKNGMVYQTPINDNLSLKVELSEEGKECMRITSFDNLGNQFLASYKEGYKMCTVCGKLVKIKSKYDNSTKYCERCAKSIEQKKVRDRVKKHRESQKCNGSV